MKYAIEPDHPGDRLISVWGFGKSTVAFLGAAGVVTNPRVVSRYNVNNERPSLSGAVRLLLRKRFSVVVTVDNKCLTEWAQRKTTAEKHDPQNFHGITIDRVLVARALRLMQPGDEVRLEISRGSVNPFAPPESFSVIRLSRGGSRCVISAMAGFAGTGADPFRLGRRAA